MTRRHHHDKRSRRGLALVLKIGAAVLVVLLVCVIAWKNETVHSRLVSAFGDNEKLQKAEYDKQRALAAKKYGSSTKEEAKVVDKESVKADPSQSSTVKKASESERSNSNSNYGTYTVQSGDYLSTIAAKYNTTVQELIELNDLESSRVAAGVTLKVPMQEQQTSTRSAATE
ncbi:LysM peptidoglycan-binding domain-containing protein [Ligilactobacillus animalis]|uniref:LysM peptidoglycan-binding domain-containing protein n=1 Tax=Ligilactobacillus animalis TaxID=1605 RepID=UPI0027C88BB3|nr:LysM peptidoglycan-binding domain-containing protein [Ligilactobacillus animalis]MDQ2234667.1 LysM peptidoglycan-binding domain-containing protein [Ligilactobacillus animalis]